MLDYLDRFILPAAYDVLPMVMDSPEASALVLAIALQESGCAHRHQVNGPARGFWQFELGGVAGVKKHPKSKTPLARALVSLCYAPTLPAGELHIAIEHNDVVACVVARLLLWTLPNYLPGRDDVDDAWTQYLKAWRPGKPRPADWPANYARAWTAIARQT